MTRLTLPLVALAGAGLGALGVAAWDRLGGGAADTPRIERVVRDYILAHPELIPEAMQKLQDRETGRLVAANRAAIETPVGSAFAGNPRGDVTLVEYYDYNCGYCRASLPVIAELVKSDSKLRVVFRELPVLAESSRTAARMSLAAADQGKFAAFHDALYAAGPVTDATIAGAAAKAGVDRARARAYAPQADAEITRNMRTASQLGMTGTPSWVIGDRIISGAQPIDKIRDAIAAARRG
jgi:protein-disulfide isomerase